MKRVLSNLTSSADELDESQRRAMIGLTKPLLVDPWKPKPEPIMTLWEGFCRKLDSAFQLPGAPASSYVIARFVLAIRHLSIILVYFIF